MYDAMITTDWGLERQKTANECFQLIVPATASVSTTYKNLERGAIMH